MRQWAAVFVAPPRTCHPPPRPRRFGRGPPFLTDLGEGGGLIYWCRFGTGRCLVRLTTRRFGRGPPFLTDTGEGEGVVIGRYEYGTARWLPTLRAAATSSPSPWARPPIPDRSWRGRVASRAFLEPSALSVTPRRLGGAFTPAVPLWNRRVNLTGKLRPRPRRLGRAVGLGVDETRVESKSNWAAISSTSLCSRSLSVGNTWRGLPLSQRQTSEKTSAKLRRASDRRGR